MKQMKRRLLALILVLVMLSSIAPGALALDISGHWWQQYVDNPMADYTIADGNPVTSQGKYVLVTSDVHRYAYLAAELLEQANAIAAAEEAGASVGLFAFGGDFANEYELYADNMSILKAGINQVSPGTVISYTKGNHERDIADEDFMAMTGMSRIGETVVNEGSNYHFFNFGALNNTQQFTEEDIAQLRTYLEGLSDAKPVVIISHFPLHYYNDRRSSKQAEAVLELLNKYPQSIFLWGHNHTEQDPNYGMIRVPGDIIQTGANADSSKEINFTYACLGALRDGWNGANGLLMKFEEGKTQLRYIKLNAAPDSSDTWTDAQGNENSVRYPSNPGVSTDTTVATPSAETFKTIRVANVQIDRPLVDKAPAKTAADYSDRFHSGEITWSGNPASFDFNTVYSVSFTLTAEDGYSFAPDAVVSVNKEYVGPMSGQKNNIADAKVSGDGKTVEVNFTFAKTAEQGDPVEAETTLTDGASYVLVSDNNVAAYYIYDPAQHGEESMPDYAALAADAVIRDGKLVSKTEAGMVFTAQRDKDGFMLWSDASLTDPNLGPAVGATTLNYLTMSTRGGELGLQASEMPDNAIYTDWNLDSNGLPYLNVDGAVRYPVYDGKNFGFTDSAADCNMRLYQVGTSSKIYNVAVNVAQPVPGGAPATEDDNSYGGYTVTGITWDTDKFDYATEYTVTATVKANDGYSFAEPYTGRVNGSDAEVKANADGTLTLTCTLTATSAKPSEAIDLPAKEVSALENGKRYVIVSGDSAMSSVTSEGIYLSAEKVTISGDTITSGLTNDLIFIAEGNDEDGYALKHDDTYLAGYSANGTPDLWGFTGTDKVSGAISWSFADNTLTVESTGSSGGPGAPPPPPPPPGAAPNTLYMNNGHFNFSTLSSSEVRVFEVATSTTTPFTDVSPDRWSYDVICQAAEKGIIKGIGENRFGPEVNLTRAMAVTMLYRMAGSPEVSGSVSFTDVTESYYTDALIWATENEVVNGRPDGTFGPDQLIARQDACAMAARFMRLMGADKVDDTKAVEFADAADIAGYAKENVELCAKAGVIVGYSDGNFRPNGQITREEIAAVFMRVYNRLP